jgi:hypothetical protein
VLSKRILIAIVLVVIISIWTASVLKFNIAKASSTIADNAKNYLASTYNASLKMVPETLDNNVYWITSDNLLAYFALKDYSSDISDSIKDTIMVYATTYGLPKDSNGLPIDYKHEAVIGDILTQQFGGTNVFSLLNGSGYTIQAEIDNGTVMSDWQNYADLVAYKGLSSYNQGDIQEATDEYNIMMRMWNGHGFNDSAYNETTGIYDTYKLALAVLLAKDCGITPNETMCSIISSMQDSNGGIHTQYTFNNTLTIVGSVNTETTALVAIAYSATITPEFSSPAILTLFMVVITIVAVAMVIRKQHIDLQSKP